MGCPQADLVSRRSGTMVGRPGMDSTLLKEVRGCSCEPLLAWQMELGGQQGSFIDRS
jgi:hypothetical protein